MSSVYRLAGLGVRVVGAEGKGQDIYITIEIRYLSPNKRVEWGTRGLLIDYSAHSWRSESLASEA